MRAALFDMDRTLVRKETASLYVRYQRHQGQATWRDQMRVLWWVSQYTLGIVDAQEVATRVAMDFAGMPETVLSARCDDWFRRCVEPHVCDRGRRAVEKHRAAGDVLAIVTGASQYATRPLARRLGIDHVVASELEVVDGHFTGRFLDPLCYGAGKITRARALADSLGFRLEDATFYSDSLTDLPLLEHVREPIIVNPDPRLMRVARKRGYRIEEW
jgi:HAD superfamily hydrolase (TIGR01490 family)